MPQAETIALRAARPEELGSLSDLCLRSKSVWGYDESFLAACRNELTLRACDLTSSDVQVAEQEGRLVGVVQVACTGATASLEKLFVAPDALRGGVGRKLFSWALGAARRRGAKVLTIEADPEAADFYRRMGARDDGTAPSGSIPGRALPRLKLELNAS
jgi:GNAT superfamily N-acetyltransferase